MAFTDGNIIIGTSVDVGGIGTGLTKIEKSFKRLGKFAAFGLGIKALSGLGKAALDAASDLQEVQNVVDVSFRELDDAGNVISDMTYKIESFSQTCIEKFGMSEFAAKQTAGSFMAMGKSMGLSMEEASDMAVTLTGLTGDFSSFYNISQDYARVALSAVYTGETETLKRYGIVLTEANLQQYAQSKGIETTVKKMDARDKAILRYMYIMQATKDMEGDFVRTQDSWANSTRVLAQLWNQFLIALGSGLVSILSPMVQVLGHIVQRLTQFVQVLWQALSNIFGFQLQDITKQASGAAGAVGDLSDSTDELGKSIDKAGKKAKKHLANFDELNNITTPSNSGSGGGGAGLGLGDMGLDTSGLWDPTKKDSPWSDIDNLYDLGKWIGDKLSDMMESIDWKKVYQKASGFGRGLAEFLNGLISTDLFKDVAHTIASSLNSVIYSAINFGLSFDWKQTGQKIAEGINEFFDTFDFKALGASIRIWVHGILDLIRETITNIDWKDVFKGVKDFFSEMDATTLATITGFIAIKKLLKGGVIKILMGALRTGLVQGITWLFSGTSLSIMASNIFSGLKYAFQMAFITLQGFFTQTIPKLASSIGSGFSSLFSSISSIVTKATSAVSSGIADLAMSFETFRGLLMGGNGLKASMEMAFGGIATTIAGIVAVLGGAVLAVKNFVDMWKNGWSLIKTILEAVGIALAAIGAVILGAPALLTGVIAGLVFAISQIVIAVHDNWDSIKSWWSGTAVPFFQMVWNYIVQFISNIAAGIKEKVMLIVNVIASVIRGSMSTISAVFNGIKNTISSILNAIKTTIISIVQSIVTGSTAPLQNMKTAWVNVFNTIKSSIVNIMSSMWNGIRNVINSILSGIQSMANNVINGINTVIRAMNAIPKINLSIPTVGQISIPHLAKGAVIPPNKEFLAVLGDQSSGTNIEAPLDTIKQALAEVMANNGGVQDTGDIVINIDGNEIFRVVRKQSKIFTKSTGVPAF